MALNACFYKQQKGGLVRAYRSPNQALVSPQQAFPLKPKLYYPFKNFHLPWQLKTINNRDYDVLNWQGDRFVGLGKWDETSEALPPIIFAGNTAKHVLVFDRRQAGGTVSSSPIIFDNDAIINCL